MPEDAKRTDVLIVGGGPCGLTTAALLGRYGWNVELFERHPRPYSLPRASLSDHEVMRVLQSVGAADRYAQSSAEGVPGYDWLNGAGQRLMSIPWLSEDLSGWPSASIGFQPRLEDELLHALEDLPNVVLHRDAEVLDALNTDDGAQITVRRVGETAAVHGRFLVAADGAGSPIREALGIEREDLGFDSKWLVVDGRASDGFPSSLTVGEISVPVSRRIVQICDPRRPIYLGPLGRGYRRFEWMLMPGEAAEEFAQEETTWSLLADLGVPRESFTIFRNIVYAFEAKLARRWRVGNIFLVGDAAHTMPPYMGQGMGSGIRDAKNLSWKLDLVLRGAASPSILHSYQTERDGHARHWITASVDVGRVSCTIDEQQARARDERFFRGEGPTGAPPEGITSGIIARDAHGAPAPLAGTLGVQGRVQVNGVVGRLDDLVRSDRFQVIGIGAPLPAIAEIEAAAGPLPLVTVLVTDDGEPTETDVIAAADVNGTYRAFAESHGIRFLLVRPDFYIFGASASPEGLVDLVGDLAGQVLGPAPRNPAESPRAVFDAGLAAGELMIQRCSACGSAIFFPRVLCPVCGVAELVDERASGAGTIYSLTLTAVRDAPARPVALIDLDEGARLMSLVPGAEAGDIGARVRWRPPDDEHPFGVFDLEDAGA